MMDLHIAVLPAIAVLALTRAPAANTSAGPARPAPDDGDVAMAVAALGLATQLKYEGRVLAAIVLGCALVTGAVRWRALRAVAGSFAAFVPIAIWLVEIKLFRIPGVFEAGRGVHAVAERLQHDYLSAILPAVVLPGSVILAASAAVVAFTYAAWAARGASIPLRDRLRLTLGVAIALAYAFVLTIVYLLSPYPDVREHIRSSIYRTVVPVELCLYAAAIAAVQWARSPAVRGGTSPAT